jgi:hypothetical protein
MTFYDEFKAIKGEAALEAFLQRHGFKEIAAAPRWNLGEYELIHNGHTFRVGYRWYDPSQAFSIQKDIHKAELWSINPIGQTQVHGNIEFEEGA